MDKPNYMSEAEYKDLEDMKAKVIEIKVRCFDYVTGVLRYDRNELDHSGYRNHSNVQAVEKILIGYNKEIEALFTKHVKKYPD